MPGHGQLHIYENHRIFWFHVEVFKCVHRCSTQNCLTPVPKTSLIVSLVGKGRGDGFTAKLNDLDRVAWRLIRRTICECYNYRDNKKFSQPALNAPENMLEC